MQSPPDRPPNLSQVSSMQLLHHQAPQAAVLILLVSPLFDDTPELLSVVFRSFSGASPASGWLHADQVDGGGVEGAEAAAVVAGEEEVVIEVEGDGKAGAMFWAGMVLLSCLLAFLVNLSTFLVIGRTSPVSYQVIDPGGLGSSVVGTGIKPAFQQAPPSRTRSPLWCSPAHYLDGGFIHPPPYQSLGLDRQTCAHPSRLAPRRKLQL